MSFSIQQLKEAGLSLVQIRQFTGAVSPSSELHGLPPAIDWMTLDPTDVGFKIGSAYAVACALPDGGLDYLKAEIKKLCSIAENKK